MKSKKFKIIMIVFLLGILINAFYLGLSEKMPVIGMSDEQLLKEKLQEELNEGKDIVLNGNEVNAIFKNYLQKPLDIGIFNIKDVAFQLQDETVSIYIPLDYKSRSLIISSEGQIAMKDDFILFRPRKIYLGKIPLPKKTILSKVSNLENKNINVKGQNIYISKKLFPLNNTKTFKVQNGKLLIKPSQILQKDPDDDKQNKKEIDEKSLQSLKKLLADLEKVEKSLKGQEKEFIQEVQSNLKLIIKNPNHPYEEDIEKLKTQYDGLSKKQKNKINWKVFLHVDMEELQLLEDFLQ